MKRAKKNVARGPARSAMSAEPAQAVSRFEKVIAGSFAPRRAPRVFVCEEEQAGYGIATDAAARVVQHGIRPQVVGLLAETVDVDKSLLLRTIGIDKATLGRREKSGQRLDAAQTEAALRAMELVTLATEVFGSAKQAGRWLEKPHPLLDGKAPLDWAGNGYGAEKVKSMLYAIRFGGVV